MLVTRQHIHHHGEIKMTQLGTGIIGEGADDYYEIVLTAGRAHQIYVRPDDPRVDFDLRIYDENENLVAYDTTYDADAYCIVTPGWTGPFRLAVTAASGGGRYTIMVED